MFYKNPLVLYGSDGSASALSFFFFFHLELLCFFNDKGALFDNVLEYNRIWLQSCSDYKTVLQG